MKKYNFSKEETCIIGDQLFTDILGGNRVGITTYLVEPLTKEDFIITKIFRKLEQRQLTKLKEIHESTIVEEIVYNCPELNIINNSSLNTIRVVTCIDSCKNCHIIGAFLRTGRKGAIIDNLLGGGTCYPINLETGIIDGKGRDAKGNYYIEHPTSHITMIGYKIPSFQEVIEYAKQLALHLPNARYVGWDID